ncbi:hypothetical protein CC1G_01511 [Coprinopsis cinerea okayama7|uniref:DUF8021 domain-containing protein n=1 Tax=Coprinopsis cinerea (strain Okayama-7 / 130 / ATCC MYA-4618 / FGSC 9003) TaxID=240176 RepID=A8NHV1_COPC7|nr:hypothetical protein CC1G_01511 [Coprinopsis cinerea okayama7\|eukprot:XP_001833834.1 hypothetical protein CC1G_01511 [Coprinopsis cinerea okayama7\
MANMLPLIALALTLGDHTLAQASCTYASLQSLTSTYVDSQTQGDPTLLISNSLLPSITYTENFKPSSLSTSILSTPLKIDHTRSLHDTTQCATYTEIIVANGEAHYVIGTQIRLGEDGESVEKIETIVTTEGDWLFNATATLYYASREDWFTIPEEERDTREAIQAGGDAYLDLFNDPTVQVPWGQPCARLEGGIYSGTIPPSPDDTCNVGVPEGMPIVDRRYVIDETVGAVDVFVDFNGPGGRPDSHEFRLEKGKLRFVHTLTYMRG